jgi:hypothetical protein
MQMLIVVNSIKQGGGIYRQKPNDEGRRRRKIKELKTFFYFSRGFGS